MTHKTRILFALAATALLVGIPFATAAPNGKGPEKAHEHGARGHERAAEAKASANASRENATGDAAPTADDGVPPAHARGHWKQFGNASADGNATATRHPGLHAGFTTAMAHVPEKVRVFFENVLSGAHPRFAKLLSLEK